jgi:hypothetical protein
MLIADTRGANKRYLSIFTVAVAVEDGLTTTCGLSTLEANNDLLQKK